MHRRSRAGQQYAFVNNVAKGRGSHGAAGHREHPAHVRLRHRGGHEKHRLHPAGLLAVSAKPVRPARDGRRCRVDFLANNTEKRFIIVHWFYGCHIEIFHNNWQAYDLENVDAHSRRLSVQVLFHHIRYVSAGVLLRPGRNDPLWDGQVRRGHRAPGKLWLARNRCGHAVPDRHR
uniref:(northern house mosquito) hypothetical protein n=1 Tax=Culex pipiens TaxID=7175 RepID=A0A8D8IF14_CULPI